MKRTIVTLATLLAAAGVANAQTTTPSSPSATTPPSPGSTTMPGSGSASGSAGAMTQAAVKSKIEASGYSNVTNLRQDLAGNWTAKATKGGQQVAVSIDSKGMVKEAQQ
jgi:periplasmic protein CpxP/Spy